MKLPVITLRELSPVAVALSLFAFAACDSDPGATSDTDAVDTSDTADTVDDTSPDVADVPDAADVSDVDTDPGPPHPALVGTEPATFTVRPGVEIITVLGATADAPITLYDQDGERLLTVIADAFGQAHFSYVGPEYITLDARVGIPGEVVRDGHTITPGPGYVLRDDSQTPPRALGPFTVLAVADHPPASFFDAAPALTGIHFGILGPIAPDDPQDGLNYITMRDGTKLSAMVRFPDPGFWGDGPWPTVVEYSGYSPSDPNNPDPGTRIATLLGYATVAVNMRGSGCSGGVFDIFSPAQHADGYDIIETVARQSFVMNHKVGMVGLSYPGISQLYVAYTRPPSLASVTPLSVLADPWIILRPGGIYNDGFTRQWLENRDSEAAPNGQSWTDQRIQMGDTLCRDHQDLRNQNLKFEDVFKYLEFYPKDAAARSLPSLVRDIDVPVYLTGAFQDEQTGPQFTEMLDAFVNSPLRRFILYNGRHVDGYSPLVLYRWFEFLELTVAQRVPRLPAWVRGIGAEEFSKEFGSTGLNFEDDRFPGFADTDYAGVLAAYKAEPEVRVLFDSGGDAAQPGAPKAAFAATFPSWPPPAAVTRVLYLDRDPAAPEFGTLSATAPTAAKADTFHHDRLAGAKTFFGPRGYETMARLWDLDWTHFPDGAVLTYETPTLTEDLVLGGPGYLTVTLSSEVSDVHLQVTLTEVRSDGLEELVTSGWLRLGHRKIDASASEGNHIAYTWKAEDYLALAAGETLTTQIPIPSVAHALRAGSRLRVAISSPGRNHGTWEFEAPTYDPAEPFHRLVLGGAKPSSLTLSVLPDFAVPTGYPACPGLRGQPCRAYAPQTNLHDD